MQRHNLSILLIGLLVLSVSTLQAKVTLPGIFTNNMVIQRDQSVNIWGWADSGETVEVTFNGQKKKTKANKEGKWIVQLKPMAFGGPHTMDIKGKSDKIRLSDILIGDVWVCSGQSNMEWVVSNSNAAEEEIANAKYPQIRAFNVIKDLSVKPKDDLKGNWEVCSPATVGNFSAVGYFFARDLYQNLQIPIGIINSSWGGTDIETWISRGTFAELPEQFESRYKNEIKDFDQFVEKNTAARELYHKALEQEPGLPGGWYKKDYDTSGWENMTVPQLWENVIGNVDGYIWFSYEFNITSELAAQSGKIYLGAIDDIDITWINGTKVGETDGYAVKREYDVPQGLLQPGKNIVTVRVLDTGGGGGMYGRPQDMYLSVLGTKIPLAGDWKYKQAVTNAQFDYIEFNPNMMPSLLYNAMINPIISLSIKGAIWYQGENNSWAATNYQTLFPTMINDWRNKWGYEFPFYWVQLANFMAKDTTPVDSDWARLREAQTMTLSVPKTGQAVIADIGDADDIHPRNKQDVGHRLALIALNKDYGKDVVYSGPTFKSMTVSGNKAIITFDNIANGLEVRCKYGCVSSFAVAGEDKVFHFARAYKEGDRIIVISDEVKNPVAVRYGWSNNPDINLYNSAGLPACPFRTDEF
ncbi:sialate O-acetylesterase [Bacteroides sp. 519]|uniref:sialate O-acetylesterase n=1 Tax=Bacteroides sp. 519 TaxID=2302937 RepID=UPI0013CFA505|nr:sialate O-acetylesterase [Bacteroides sp. 519]NDV59098.1 9-O-acetylesterase [Bacteroides sp. 519]